MHSTSCSSSASTFSPSLRPSCRPRSCSPSPMPNPPRLSLATPPTLPRAVSSPAPGVPGPLRWRARTRSTAKCHGSLPASRPRSCCSSNTSTLSSWSMPARCSRKATSKPGVPAASNQLECREVQVDSGWPVACRGILFRRFLPTLPTL